MLEKVKAKDNELGQMIDDYIKQKRYPQINSVLLYQNGQIIVERYYNKFTKESRNPIKSIWKSIISIGIGICLDKGSIESLDEPICRYLEVFNQNNHPYHKLITIKHLLTMTSGIYWNGGKHYHCPMLEQLRRTQDWLAHLADIQMEEVPGRKHVYKEWDVILLSAIISQVTGMNTFDFCNSYLFTPLDIKSEKWWTSPCGITYNIGNKPLDEATSHLCARDLAKIGNLFLNSGKYNGKQIISVSYIKEATTPTEQNSNYGFLWWLGDGWYGCRGFGGQEIRVMPEQNRVGIIQATPTSLGKSYEDVFVLCNQASPILE